MKYLIFFVAFFYSEGGFAQVQRPDAYAKFFNGELKQWATTFSDFSLSEFSIKDSLHFDGSEKRDLASIHSFLRTYKSILTFSTDSTQFIDIYTGQLNISKEGDHYVANPDDGGAVFLCNLKTGYWNRIYYNSISQWIAEVVWVSSSRFIMVGISKNEKDQRLPLIVIGDESRQVLYEYLDTNKLCYQRGKAWYESPKLKRMDIRGL